MVRSKESTSSEKSSEARERRERPVSGVYTIPLAVAAAYGVAVARDEYVGLDRLDREELDETDEDVARRSAEVRVIVPRTLRRTA